MDNPSAPVPGWNIAQFGLACLFILPINLFHVLSFHASLMGPTFWISHHMSMILFLPLLYIQLYLGATVKRGIVGIFGRFIPYVKGIGIAALLVTTLLLTAQAFLVGQVLSLTFASMISPYPWTKCSNAWNSPNCVEKTPNPVNVTMDGYMVNYTRVESYSIYDQMDLPEYQFSRNFVDRKDGSLFDIGEIQWFYALALLGVWILVFAATCAGPRIFGFVLYVIGSLAILLMFIVMAYGFIQYPSNIKKKLHIMGYVMDDMKFQTSVTVVTRILRIIAWNLALVGIFSGVLPTLGKFVGVQTKTAAVPHILWLFVFLIHTLLPHLISITFIPYIAATNEKIFGDLIARTMPFICSQLDIPNAMAAIIFLMVTLFGLLSMSVITFCIVDNLLEVFSSVWLSKFKKQWLVRFIITLVFSVVCLLCGLPFTAKGGGFAASFLDYTSYSLHLFLMWIFLFALLVSYGRSQVRLAVKLVVLIIAGILSVSLVGFAVAESGIVLWAIELIAKDKGYHFSTKADFVMFSMSDGIYQQLLNTRGSWIESDHRTVWLVTSIVVIFLALVVGFIHALVITKGPCLKRLKHVFTSHHSYKFTRQNDEPQSGVNQPLLASAPDTELMTQKETVM